MKLSIITINYNNAEGLRRTIQSIVPQTEKLDLEYIIIDGASTDGSVDVIKEYADKIAYSISEPDKGIYNAMNKGIDKARGDYVMFINSGDDLMPMADLEAVLNTAKDGEDIIYCNLHVVRQTESYVKKYPQFLDFKYFAEDTIPHSGTLIKRDLFNTVGYYREDMKIVSDWAFFMDAVLLHNCTYRYVDDCFASFYDDGISSRPENFPLLMSERDKHIASSYPHLNSLYLDWKDKRLELYKLKTSTSVRALKKIGFLKWLNL